MVISGHYRNGLLLLIAILLMVFTTVMDCSGLCSATAEGTAYGDLRWYRLDAPGTKAGKHDIESPCDIRDLVVCPDGFTIYAIDTANADRRTGSKAIYKSIDCGVSWSDKPGVNLFQSMSTSERNNFRIWYIAATPDNSNSIAVVTNNSSTDLPRNIWYSPDGGASWNNLEFTSTTLISCLAMSPQDAGFIAAGLRSGTGIGTIMIRQIGKSGTWKAQNIIADILAVKFSPDYVRDFSILCLASDTKESYFNIGFHDAGANITDWSGAYSEGAPRIVYDGISPSAGQVVSASLAIASDFSGRHAALRNCYVSIDDASATTAGGIYRINDRIVTRIFKATSQRRIASISYHGNNRNGKLLAGEVLGTAGKAAVNTWFTGNPSTCSDSCWYTAQKPPTGAAGTDNCTGGRNGNAIVAWSPDGSTAFCATGSSANTVAGPGWTNPYMMGCALDESALSISRDNGKTWNGISLIDTMVSCYIDVAPSPDSSAVFLASINANPGCRGFDSLWRCLDAAAYNKWERVFCDLTGDAGSADNQSNLMSLRMASDSIDGRYLACCIAGTRRILISDDRGQSWMQIRLKRPLADAAFETNRTLYTVDREGMVKVFRREQTGWIPREEFSSGLSSAYSIATAFTGMTPDNDSGCVVVAGTGEGDFDVAFSLDGGKNFKQIMKTLPVRRNTRAIFASSFRYDGTIIAVNRGGMFAWCIFAGQTGWEEWWGGEAWPSPVTSICISRNYSMYFNTPATWNNALSYVRWSSASAGLDPSVSLGCPDNPDTGLRISGGLVYEEPVILWNIDQRPVSVSSGTGGLWLYRDTLLWNGPTPLSPTMMTPVNCDTVTGRAQQIELKWKPRSLARGYQVQVAKDPDFRYLVVNIGADYFGPYYVPYNLDSPALFIPPGGGIVTDARGSKWRVPALEAGRIYYWRVKVQDVVTGDMIKSPQSFSESFSIRSGLPVRSPTN